MANRNWASGGKIYSMHVSPVLIDCHFQVDSTATTGISNLKGPAVQAAYLHSAAATPSLGTQNPIAGVILVQLADNYSKLFDVNVSMSSPTSGSALKIDNSALTAGTPYTITTVGDATAAKWLAIGVPAGVTPAVGVSFIAKTNGGSGNVLTSRVMASKANGSAVYTCELMSSPQADLAPSPTANQGFGAQLIFICRDAAGALVAPVDGSVIHITMYLSNSSITIAGE